MPYLTQDIIGGYSKIVYGKGGEFVEIIHKTASGDMALVKGENCIFHVKLSYLNDEISDIIVSNDKQLKTYPQKVRWAKNGKQKDENKQLLFDF